MPQIIQLKNIKKTYKLKEKTLTIFDGFNFEIEQGKMTAIMGRSGAGKSTLLQIMSMLDKPDSGEISIGGQNIDYNNPKIVFETRAKDISFVFQSFYLQPELTVLENVELPLSVQGIDRAVRKEKALEVLEYLGIKDKANNMPSQISGGQIQRVAIARAIVSNPKIIFADEPTGNLDDQTTAEVLALFRQIQKKLGTTIVIVTHSPEVAQACDFVFNLNTISYENA